MKINESNLAGAQNLSKVKDKFAGIPKEFIEVAESMEAQFADHLLQQMKKTVSKENPDSSAVNYYNSLMDSERAKLMSKGEHSLGLKEIILDQIYPEHLRNKNNHAVKMYKEHGSEKTKGAL